MRSPIAGLSCAAMLLVGSAQAATLEVMKKNLDRYVPYLQGSVEKIEYDRPLDRFNYRAWPIGPDKVLVRMSREKAYLVTTEAPCQRLQWVGDVLFTRRQSNYEVVRGKDDVLAGAMSCRIADIQSIDYARMRKDGLANPYY